jgi:alkanesulfonate monooxygenase SsuD/methylene tetrahydromethanopterin reductase-like flavin-dependent oxidoreductase (luciferase family)
VPDTPGIVVLSMKYGFVVPGGDVQDIVDCASEAEAAGWDGIFHYDADWSLSPWVILAAMAVRTSRIRLGAMLHPLPWRRPWLLARDAATLDRLSGGRLVLPVGLGAVDEADFERGTTRFGEPTDRRLRARRLDEGLDIVTALWRGEPVTYRGEHYRTEELRLEVVPLQSPRVPIWVVGIWPHSRSMQRAMRYDGLLVGGGVGSAGDLAEVTAAVAAGRSSEGAFDVVVEGRTAGGDPGLAATTVRPWAEAGATWWMESMWESPNSPGDVRTRIGQGPPRVTEAS